MELTLRAKQGTVSKEAWRNVNFGDLYAVPSRNGVYKAETFHGRGYRIVNMGEMFGLDFISDQEMSLVELNGAEIASSLLKEGDLLFGRRSVVESGAGKCSLVVKSKEPLTFESSIIRVRLLGDAFPLFYYYFFASAVGRAQMRNIISGTNVKGIRGSELRALTVPLPSSQEQRIIASALSDVDVLLLKLDQVLGKKRDLKQGAMQELLTGKHRLPGFDGQWQRLRLGSVGTFSKGAGIRRDDVLTEGIPCVRYGELYTHYNDYIRTFNSFITRTVADTSRRLRTGELLFAGSGETAEEIGKCAAYLGAEEAYAGGDIVIFTPRDQDSMYLGYLMNHPAVVAQKTRMGQGDAVVHISARNLSAIEIALPEYAEQVAIAGVLRDIDAEIDALEARRDKTRAIKQGMMQELLTGRIRLV